MYENRGFKSSIWKYKIILKRYLIPRVIPEEITTSILFCINKKAD